MIDKEHDENFQYRNISTWTEGVYIENLRKMGGEKRLKVAFQLYEMAVNLSKQNIIESNPSITGKELKKKLFERFGYDTGSRVAGKLTKGSRQLILKLPEKFLHQEEWRAWEGMSLSVEFG